MTPLALDPKTTALVLIDLQNGIVSRPTAPHTGAAVLANGVRLANRFREVGAVVVLVRVSFSHDWADALRLPCDEPFVPGQLPADWAELAPALGQRASDIVLVKRQWGAFYGTELDLQLRRRGVRTIVLGGIATNIGVESTARAAYELGYAQVFVEDAMASMSAEAHAASVKFTFPRIGHVRPTDAVLAALKN